MGGGTSDEVLQRVHLHALHFFCLPKLQGTWLSFSRRDVGRASRPAQLVMRWRAGEWKTQGMKGFNCSSRPSPSCILLGRHDPQEQTSHTA